MIGAKLNFKKITVVHIKNGLERGKSSRELVSTEQGERIIKNSVTAKSKRHNGIYSIILFMYIKYTDMQRHVFFWFTWVYWSGCLCGERGSEWRLELIKDNKTRDTP